MESIKASELRIGNIIQDGTEERVVDGEMICWLEDKETFTKTWQGIPLTPEILLKAGFEFSEDGTFAYQQDYLYIDIIRGKYVYMHPYHPLKLQYLHQLQNLYFSLTSHELTINL